jgi:hypothetical protein
MLVSPRWSLAYPHANNDNDDRSTSTPTALRLALLTEMARTGQILARAKRQLSATDFDRLLQQRRITADQATVYIILYENFQAVEEAAKWHYDRHGETLQTPHEVLALLTHWREQHH